MVLYILQSRHANTCEAYVEFFAYFLPILKTGLLLVDWFSDLDKAFQVKALRVLIKAKAFR